LSGAQHCGGSYDADGNGELDLEEFTRVVGPARP
jgi:hypothetical protein